MLLYRRFLYLEIIDVVKSIRESPRISIVEDSIHETGQECERDGYREFGLIFDLSKNRDNLDEKLKKKEKNVE